jgi:hypothetical protein
MSLENVLNEVSALHASKSQGYGLPDDPYHNIRQAGRLVGIPAWAASISRAGDKITRISAHLNGASVTDEKLRDNLLDMVVYCAIALDLYDEVHHPGFPKADTRDFLDRLNRIMAEAREAE